MFHKEGAKIILITLLLVVGIIFLTDAFVSINWLRTALYLFALVILVLVLQFFRNPTRVADNSDNHILAPVDGKVVVMTVKQNVCKMKAMSSSVGLTFPPVANLGGI